MTISDDSPEPAYVQLAGILRRRIQAGEITGALPSLRTLTETYGVGQFAVLHALRVLADDGVIFSVPRRGYYVRQPPAE